MQSLRDKGVEQQLPELPHRGHELPVALFVLVGVIGGFVGVAVVAVAVGPVVLLVVTVLGRAVVGIVDGVHAADVVVEFLDRTAGFGTRASAGGTRGGELAVNGGKHGVVVGADLAAERGGGSDLIVAGLDLAMELLV